MACVRISEFLKKNLLDLIQLNLDQRGYPPHLLCHSLALGLCPRQSSFKTLGFYWLAATGITQLEFEFQLELKLVARSGVGRN